MLVTDTAENLDLVDPLDDGLWSCDGAARLAFDEAGPAVAAV